MRTAKADESICSVAKTEKNAADFEIEISLGAAGKTSVAQIEDCAEEGEEERGKGSDGCG